ncbi:hypothetical protein [Mucilaginibacter ginsenosidivorax]|uniref:Uncharacterized protein n=1 Tax=Mucilaginibacter ginsenosidivorax TaxID=862126 RepID=A0A5B8VUJ9_9SPHI|nr:hypothetical protein [Mucilaginibacter ginsenosidivorax]QEC74811.1 hypothetical protein FSB76_02200 [Mucilaginibacter ginsenosidivorax]
MIEVKDYITIAGIAVSVIFSFCSLIVGLKNAKKTLFINSVTASRIKWMDTVRTSISEYCGLILHVGLTDIDDEKEERLIIEKIDRLRFSIKLQLNRFDSFDRKIIEKVDHLSIIIEDEDLEDEVLESELNQLVILTQDILKLEWEGIKQEVRKGNLAKREKLALYYKHHLPNAHND